MKFLLDEGVAYRLAALLRDEGHDVVSCGRELPQALPDREILELAVRERRVVLTNDKDFGELVFRDGMPHAGIVLFRLDDVPMSARVDYLRRVLHEHTHLLHQFIVVSPQAIRVRADAQPD